MKTSFCRLCIWGSVLIGFGYAQTPNAWINEFHYDNVSTDTGEFCEIAIESPGSYALSDFQLDRYNGTNGTTYETAVTLDAFTVGSTYNNITLYYYDFPKGGLQNGTPDGLALSYQSSLISGQFLSYEGTFAGSTGVANEITSTDIGVSETGSTPVGYSLQLVGSGTQYSDFTWSGPAPETKGTPNSDGTTDQSLPITLSLWSGISKNGQVLLNWTTDSEIENLGFIIERALTEKGPWNEVASFSTDDALKGRGSTNNTTNYHYTDTAVEVGRTYYYRLSDVNYKGARTTHAVISVLVSAAGQNAFPGAFRLERIYPNPFNPGVTVSLTVNKPGYITVNLFDLRGRLVNQLSQTNYEAGSYHLRWNGLIQNGRPAPSGVYLLRVSDGESALVRKLVLAR